jgi:hypothetical protein
MEKVEKGADSANSDQNTVVIEKVASLEENLEGKNKTFQVEEEIDGKEIIENKAALFVEADGEKYEEENDKDILQNKDSFNRVGSQNSRMGLLEQSAAKTKLQDEIIEFKEVPLQDNCESEVEDPTKFFSREWKAFKNERYTKLSDKKKISTVLDFDELRKEWKSEGNENHWSQKQIKKEGETCSVLFSTIVTGILFTLIPNCAIVLDYMTANEYLFGNYYLKYDNDEKNLTNCKIEGGRTYCLEYDPVYGTLTLLLTFLAGPFWSFGLFIQFGTYLRKIKPEVFQRKRVLFFLFLPIAILCMVSFPIQLFVVSLISCFNDQNQWMLLTTKIGITEGMFNAHSQYMLQLFIFFTRGDRHPSWVQYLAAFGSLIFLAYSRIESLLLDRGGHYMSPGQKAWWILRFGPCFLFNCAFKVGSISLVIAMLRFNSIWLYGTILLIWFLLQILFNEQCLPRKYYYLFIGAGLHAVSVAHIPEDIKLIDTNPDSKKNILWSTRLTSRQLRFNLLFQNFIWFISNFIIIVTLTIVSSFEPDIRIPTFWPFTTDHTYSFKENKVYRILYIVAPVLLLTGLTSQVLLWMFEFKTEDKETLKKNIGLNKKDAVDGLRQLSTDSEDHTCTADVLYDGWRHDKRHCEGCHDDSHWHRHVDDNVLQSGVQGSLSRILFPLMNVWQNVVDKNTA